MFRTSIEQLKNHETKAFITFKEGETDYLIVKIFKKTTFQYYAIDKTHPLGSGTYGTVYKAYPIKDNGDATFDKPLALKVIEDKSNYTENEIKKLSQHYHVEKVVFVENQVWILEEYVPGLDLIPCLKAHRFTFNQVVEIMWRIAVNLNQIHHHSQKTGPALIHGDLKPDNIRVDYNPDTGEINAYIIDFGHSEEALTNPDEVKSSACGKGSIYYNAPECYNGRYSVKSDIYALTPIFLYLLSAASPLRLKKAHNNPMANLAYVNMYIVNTPFCFEGIFSSLDIPDNLTFVKPLIIELLKRMQSSSDELRPNAEEVMRFMTSLRIITHFAIQDFEDIHELEVNLAKLILIAYGSWKKPFNFENDQHIYIPNILASVVILHHHKLLTSDIIKFLTKENNTLSYAIHIFNSHIDLNQDCLITIIKLLEQNSLTIDQIHQIVNFYEAAHQLDNDALNSNQSYFYQMLFLVVQEINKLPVIISNLLQENNNKTWPSFVLYFMDNKAFFEKVCGMEICKIIDDIMLTQLNNYITEIEKRLKFTNNNLDEYRGIFSSLELGYPIGVKYDASKFLLKAINDKTFRSHFFEPNYATLRAACDQGELKKIAKPYSTAFKSNLKNVI